MKKNILVISVGLWPPLIDVSGMGAIHELLKLLTKNKQFEIHVLSNLSSSSSWSKRQTSEWVAKQRNRFNIRYHFIKADNLPFIWMLFLAKAVGLNRQYRFDLIHTYSASPLLITWTKLTGKICRTSTLHTLCAINRGYAGSLWLPANPKFGKIIITSKLLKQGAKGKLSYLPLGVDIHKFKPQQKSFQNTILFLGSLEKRKGVHTLVKAVRKTTKKYPKLKLIIATYGKEVRDRNYHQNKERIKELASGTNLKIVEGRQHIPQLLASADIFVLPAVSLHGTLTPPITLIEAMSSGKTCIVSDVCEGDGLVEDQVNCLLFQSGNATDLRDKIEQAISDDFLRKRLEKNARHKVVKNFDIRKIAEELARIYPSATAENTAKH